MGTGEALLGPGPAGARSEPVYNQSTWEGPGSREGVGGGYSSDDGRDSITRPERRAPTSSVQVEEGGTLMSAGVSARSVRQATGLGPVRALQRVLYRSAKQDRTRRFHALYDKLARSDVMWRAGADVATTHGAPSQSGVRVFFVGRDSWRSARSTLCFGLCTMRTSSCVTERGNGVGAFVVREK